MKRFSLVSILLLLCFSLLAQPRLQQEEMYVGVHAGVLASMVTFSPTVEQSATHPFWGANGGFVFRYNGHKVCGLQVELNYMQRGWHETRTGYQRQIDYLELPFLTHLSFGRRFKGFVNLGPQIGYALREKHENLPSDMTNLFPTAQYLSIDNRFDWGIAGGLGMLYNSKAGVYQLEARFNYSFGDYFSNSKFATFARSCPMNLSLNFAWLWPIR